jgi:outer membrane lipoprotein-sorting protein
MIGRIQVGLGLLAAVAFASSGAFAQETAKQLPANPVGASGGNWSQSVTRDGAITGEALDKKQIDLIQKVSAYFNQLPDMKGAFVQTSADNKRVRGKFYVKKPGRFRFDYAPPSRLVILSDGDYLVIQDHDLKTDDRVALDQTPFRVLLRKDVDLLRDARILEVTDIDDVVIVALQDKSPDAPGRIKLFLAKKPGLELKEWITTDSQGLDTRIELTEISKPEPLDPALFKPSPLALQKLQP